LRFVSFVAVKEEVMYCIDLNAITFFGMITMWYFLAVAFLVDKRVFNRAPRFQYFTVAVLFVWCLFALIFGRFAERLYAITTICGMTAVEFLILRKRRLQRQHNEPEKLDTSV
jgi:hypothetical protein